MYHYKVHCLQSKYHVLAQLDKVRFLEWLFISINIAFLDLSKNSV